ncbi:MAG: hypothetical protein QW279_12965 [Candidatus Jordarchaeaceae archaeon]
MKRYKARSLLATILSLSLLTLNIYLLVISGMKVYKAFKNKDLQNSLQIDASATNLKQEEISEEKLNFETPTPFLSNSDIEAKEENPSHHPNQSKSQACIVTLFGKQYDITNMEIKPEERSIFVCGEDISEAYKNRFGEKVGRLKKYQINPTIENKDDD